MNFLKCDICDKKADYIDTEIILCFNCYLSFKHKQEILEEIWDFYNDICRHKTTWENVIKNLRNKYLLKNTLLKNKYIKNE